MLLSTLLPALVGCTGAIQKQPPPLPDTTPQALRKPRPNENIYQNSLDQEPITVQAPSVVATVVDGDSEGSLRIAIRESGYQLRFGRRDTLLRAAPELDRFIRNNQARIDRNKLLIVGSPATSGERFKTLTGLLRHYGYDRFRLVTE